MARSSRRFRNVLANALGSLMEPAENPRQSSADADPYQRQQLLLMQVHQALQDLETTRRRFMQQAATAQAQAEDLKEQAIDALNAGRDDMARPALRRRSTFVAEIAALEQHIQEILSEEERLAQLEQKLGAQIEILRARQQLAAARRTAAGAQVRIGEALYGVSDELTDVALALDQNEQETEMLQARANAITDLAGRGSLVLSDPLLRGASKQASVQPETSADIESQLDLLRQELASGSDPHTEAHHDP